MATPTERRSQSEAASGSVVVRALGEDALRHVTELHRQLLGHEFFPRLGPRFMRSYYRTFIESPYALAFVAGPADAPTAVLVGTTANRAHYKWIMRNRRRGLAAAGIVGLIVRPRLLVHFVRTRSRRYARGLRRLRPGGSSSYAAAAGGHGADVAVLTHVMTAPGAQGEGLASCLVGHFAERARSLGAPRIELVTLAPPHGAGPFYERLGWQHDGLGVNMDGDALVRYRLALDADYSRADDA